MTEQFVLDSLIAQQTVTVGDLPLTHVVLNDDANFPWLMLMPRRPNVSELSDLSQNDRAVLMEEIVRASTTLKDVTRCDKINVASFGNLVAQLHVHVIARFHTDSAWPKSVWNAPPRKDYDPAKRAALVAAVRKRLAMKG